MRDPHTASNTASAFVRRLVSGGRNTQLKRYYSAIGGLGVSSNNHASHCHNNSAVKEKNGMRKSLKKKEKSRAYSQVWNCGNEIAPKKITSSDSNLKMYGIRTKSSWHSKMASRSFKVHVFLLSCKSYSRKSDCRVVEAGAQRRLLVHLYCHSTDCLRHKNMRAWGIASWSRALGHLVKCSVSPTAKAHALQGEPGSCGTFCSFPPCSETLDQQC